MRAGPSEPFYTYKRFMVDRYGEPLFRIPVDLGNSCPHRTSDGKGGCSFCAAHGARARQNLEAVNLKEQVNQATQFARRRYHAKSYMLYFQAHTPTFCSLARARTRWREILNMAPFRALAIGARPDCLSNEMLDFLAELSQHLDVWVDLGVQTASDRTLERVNRAHSWNESRRAIETLNARGIKVGVHAMIGLPGEDASDFRRTADALAELPIDGVKIHNLHLIRGTRLTEEYRLEPFPVFGPHEYGQYLMDFIRRMPPDIPIMRICTDSPASDLVAPQWGIEKGQFIEYVKKQMIYREWAQGDLFEEFPAAERTSDAENCSSDKVLFEALSTEDGSISFWNPEFKEHYHSPVGARLEAHRKYVEPSSIVARSLQGPVRLLDICFGLGYNTLSALDAVLRANPSASIAVDALEMDRRVVGRSAEELINRSKDVFDWRDSVEQIYKHGFWELESATLKVHWGDARWTIQQLNGPGYDLVFLDAFSTQRNSQLWTLDFLRKIGGVLRQGGALLTYCAALPVRSALLQAGFEVGQTEPIGRKRGGTIATLQSARSLRALDENELYLIRKTPRGIAYRDPKGCWTNKQILRHRQERVVRHKRAAQKAASERAG